MKILLAFTPFHTPTSPPFGLAYLKAALAEARPDVDVQTIDWNLAFFRRWLRSEVPDPCRHHPTQLLGTVCPSLIVESGLGEMILDDLGRLPTTSEQQDRYMQAARLLDDIYNRLAGLYHDILFSVVEGRAELSPEAADELFRIELDCVASEQPDVVGFSILAEQNLLYALALGRVIRWVYYILGQCYAALDQPAEALESLDRAEARDWLEPEINEAKARCLQALNRRKEARRERAKARRKQRYLEGVELPQVTG